MGYELLKQLCDELNSILNNNNVDRDQTELPTTNNNPDNEDVELATDKQKQYMTKLGIRWDEKTTKDEASDLISKKLGEG